MSLEFQQIVFPTDFSENAQEALPFAAEIAKQSGAELILFHSTQSSMDLTPGFEDNQEKAIENTSRYFDELVANLRKDDRYGSVGISTMLETGQASTSLLNQIAKDKPGLVVMGTRGETNNRNVIFGTVTTNIIQKSGVPVLAVPGGSTLDFKNIVFTTDCKRGDIAALEQTISFAKLFDARVTVLHISEQKDFENEVRFRGFRDLLESRFSYEKLDFHVKYENDFFPGLADYLKKHPASLLVITRYKRSFWEKLTDRDHSKEIAFYTNVPLLMLIGDPKSFKSTFFDQAETHNA